MKMVVNNSLFDTEKAELCGSSIPYKVSLYRRTDDGIYFTVAVSRQTFRSPADYCKAVRVYETVETIVRPLTDAEALTWAEHNLAPETVNVLFLE